MRIVPLPEVFRVRYGLSPVNITKDNNSFRNWFKTADMERLTSKRFFFLKGPFSQNSVYKMKRLAAKGSRDYQ